jgi:VanZ family protein
MSRSVPWRWFPAGAWATLILVLSSVPARDLPASGVNDKILHFGVFLVLGILVGLAPRARPTLRRFAISWVALALFAAIDEAHQALIPGRMVDFLDWAANFAGLTLGLLAVAAWRRFDGGSGVLMSP